MKDDLWDAADDKPTCSGDMTQSASVLQPGCVDDGAGTAGGELEPSITDDDFRLHEPASPDTADEDYDDAAEADISDEEVNDPGSMGRYMPKTPRKEKVENVTAPQRPLIQQQLLHCAAALSQPGGNCTCCNALRGGLMRCEECNFKLCTDCDDRIHAQFPLHDRVALLDDLQQPLTPLETVVRQADGKLGICSVQSVRSLPCRAPCSCNDQDHASKWEAMLTPGQQTTQLPTFAFINLQGT